MLKESVDFGDTRYYREVDDLSQGIGRYSEPLSFLDNDEWYATYFQKVDGMFWMIGMVFKSEDHGRKVFDAISAWNDSRTEGPEPPQDEDRKNDIHLSFIIEKNGKYSFYIYPGLEEELAEIPIFSAILCRVFPYPETSMLRTFAAEYQAEPAPFLFKPIYMDGDQMMPITGIKPIWKFHIRVQSRERLDPMTVEAQHGKMFDR